MHSELSMNFTGVSIKIPEIGSKVDQKPVFKLNQHGFDNRMSEAKAGDFFP